MTIDTKSTPNAVFNCTCNNVTCGNVDQRKGYELGDDARCTVCGTGYYQIQPEAATDAEGNVILTHYLAVGNNSWGKGTTEAEAVKKLRSITRKKPTAIYRIPADYYLDGMGTGHGSAQPEFVSGTDQRA
jgi:hypothetical protein